MEERAAAGAVDGAPAWFGEPAFGQRVLAAVVDVLVFLAVSFVLLQVPFGLASQRLLWTLLNALYVILATMLTGQTVGKRLLGIRVVDVATGELPSPKAAVVRWAVVAVPLLIGWVSPVVASYTGWFSFAAYVPILKGPQHRGVHDLVAGTIVTRARD